MSSTRLVKQPSAHSFAFAYRSLQTSLRFPALSPSSHGAANVDDEILFGCSIMFHTCPGSRADGKAPSHFPFRVPCLKSERRRVCPRPKNRHRCPVYDSVLTRALLFVTFTPNCLALAMISMRFRAETEWEILLAC